jgi:type VI secretion system secreted protein VgrG
MSDSGRVFELFAGSLGVEQLEVLRFRGSEGISRLYRFDVEARIAARDAAELERVTVGREAGLLIRGAGGLDRRVPGIVTRAASLGVDARGFHRVELRLGPRLWLSGRRKGCRVFQDLDVVEIVERVLAPIGIVLLLNLRKSYERRVYCVQYHETDLDFVRRILSEEGIFFYFDMPVDGWGMPALVLADDAKLYRHLGPSLPFRPDEGLGSTGDHVQQLARRRTIAPGRTHIREYDWRVPALHATASADAERLKGSFDEGVLEMYWHYDDYEGSPVDAALAELHLEQHRGEAQLAFGESRSRQLFPGLAFQLEGHPVDGLDQMWAVVALEHEGRRDPDAAGGGEVAYLNRFRCVPGNVAYRPRRRERPLQQVLETARVVGPAGEEIYTDEFGRIKVQFHWDREGHNDEHSSCWLRVMQPWAGPHWGHQFIPRVGMEVVVMFVTGDADKPIVLGSVWNGERPEPYALPAQRTKSGIKTQSVGNPHGYNELSFDDRAGAERVHLRAEAARTQRHRARRARRSRRLGKRRRASPPSPNLRSPARPPPNPPRRLPLYLRRPATRPAPTRQVARNRPRDRRPRHRPRLHPLGPARRPSRHQRLIPARARPRWAALAATERPAPRGSAATASAARTPAPAAA